MPYVSFPGEETVVINDSPANDVKAQYVFLKHQKLSWSLGIGHPMSSKNFVDFSLGKSRVAKILRQVSRTNEPRKSDRLASKEKRKCFATKMKQNLLQVNEDPAELWITATWETMKSGGFVVNKAMLKNHIQPLFGYLTTVYKNENFETRFLFLHFQMLKASLVFLGSMKNNYSIPHRTLKERIISGLEDTNVERGAFKSWMEKLEFDPTWTFEDFGKALLKICFDNEVDFQSSCILIHGEQNQEQKRLCRNYCALEDRIAEIAGELFSEKSTNRKLSMEYLELYNKFRSLQKKYLQLLKNSVQSK